MKMKNKFNISIFSLLILLSSCDDFEKYELPESNSIEDLTPPQAVFTAIQSEDVDNDGWKDYFFSNGSWNKGKKNIKR